MSNNETRDRRFFHSFPRPKKDEPEDATLDRGLRILTLMKQAGLVLAPEIVKWNMSALGAKDFSVLQRRASFTELHLNELGAHGRVFGPIALSFDIAKLRGAGATPVIYVPQGSAENPLSLIALFCVNGAYHTKYVLSQLQQLKQVTDPAMAIELLKRPLAPGCTVKLANTDPAGNVVAEYTVLADDIRHVLQHVGFNNIPFDHSAGVLGAFLNMFYPTDNPYTNDQLGYYRQREWRLIGDNVNIKGRPISRGLSAPEVGRLEQIDPEFWARELTADGVQRRRSELALLYDPLPDWDFLDLVEEIFVPQGATDLVRAIVGDKIAVSPQPAFRGSTT
jgi:hypothetical protein